MGARSRRPSRACSVTPSASASTCVISKRSCKVAPGGDRGADQRVIELDAADEQHAGIGALDVERRVVRALRGAAVEMRCTSIAGERRLEPRKSPQRAQADAAAARLVARKRRAIDEQRLDAGRRQRPRRHRAGRAGAGDDDVSVEGHGSSPDPLISSGRFGGLPCISRPTRKIRPAGPDEAARSIRPGSTTERAPARAAGPAASPVRSIIANGVIVGNSDSPTASADSGARITTNEPRYARITRHHRRLHHALRVLEIRARRSERQEDRPEHQRGADQEHQEPADQDRIDQIRTAEPKRRVDAAAESRRAPGGTTPPTTPEQLAGQQLERRHRSEQHLADLAHLLLDDRVEQVLRAGHHRHEHQDQQEERHAEPLELVHFLGFGRPCRPPRVRPGRTSSAACARSAS